jgi:hypothetical protein
MSYKRDLQKLAFRYNRRVTQKKHYRLIGQRGPAIIASCSPRRPEVALAATERLLKRYAR